MTEAEEYRSLLEQKKGLVFELLRLSNDVGLKEGPPEQNADRYVDFVEAREVLIDKLKPIEEALAGFGRQQDLADATAELRQEIQTMGEQVIRLEPDIHRKALAMSVYFQRRINGINTQKQDAQSRGEYTKGLRYQQKV
jgi:alpha-ketoglutarate-dependent taurine dioxygenase